MRPSLSLPRRYDFRARRTSVIYARADRGKCGSGSERDGGQIRHKEVAERTGGTYQRAKYNGAAGVAGGGVVG